LSITPLSALWLFCAAAFEAVDLLFDAPEEADPVVVFFLVAKEMILSNANDINRYPKRLREAGAGHPFPSWAFSPMIT